MATVLVVDTLSQPGDPGGISVLEAAGVDLRFTPIPLQASAAELIRYHRGCFAVLASSHAYTDEVFAGAEELCVVARLGVGYDAIDVAAATRHGVTITTTPGTLEWAVADHTFGLMVGLAHHIAQHDRAIRRGEWRPFAGVDVARKTLGLIGLGRIGQVVVQRARGFDMHILACEPNPDQAFVAANGIELVALDELLARSDFVSLHVPSTPETRGMIDARRLRRMKPGAFLINTSRGALIDEDALFEALQSGHLGGAGLDVRAVEPSHEARFAAFENVIMTPHVASLTDGKQLASSTMAAQSILSVLRHEQPAGIVNPEVWTRPGLRLPPSEP